jgi:hypothetical protein
MDLLRYFKVQLDLKIQTININSLDFTLTKILL